MSTNSDIITPEIEATIMTVPEKRVARATCSKNLSLLPCIMAMLRNPIFYTRVFYSGSSWFACFLVVGVLSQL